MPIRPSNMSSHSRKGGTRTNPSIQAIAQIMSTPHIISEEDNGGDDSDSDFSFEIEEEIVRKQIRKTKVATTTNNVATTKTQTKHGRSAPQPTARTDIVSRESHGLKNKVEQTLTVVKPSHNKSTINYKPPPKVDDASFDESIMSDDDFSISVASERDALVNDKSLAAATVVKQSVEQQKLAMRGDTSVAAASTTSSKTSAIQSLMEQLSSVGDKSDSKSIPSQPSIVTATAKSTTSSKVQSLRSKAAGSIDFAESVIKSHTDIESGASTALSTTYSSSKVEQRLFSTSDGTLGGQKVVVVTSPNSSKRSSRRKICCIVGVILVAAGCAIGALVALDIMHLNNKPTSGESLDETTLTASYSDRPWYVDWNKFQCVMNCNGRPPCGGTMKTADETFHTLEECCSDGMSAFIDEHWTLETCMEMNAVDDTAIPTFAPTHEKKETSAPTKSPVAVTPPPADSSELLYFADYSEMKCLLKNSARKAQWEKGYDSKSDCCEANFLWGLYDECLGEVDSNTETIALYYPDYGERNCVEEDVSSKQSWDRGFDTKDECCEVNFSWDRESICFRGDVSMTKSPSNMPTPSPIQMPTSQPTLRPTSSHPTISPSRIPTSSPIIPGSPTRSPILSPTTLPSESPSSSPTLVPTISFSPTSEPSANPSFSPTGPTPSPTGELELLRAILVQRSPMSTDNLMLESSPQYRAMEWLVGNTLFDSYPDDRMIQRWALSTFYYSLYGSDWAVKDGWVNHKGNFEHECTWHGVTCTEGGAIMSIDLIGNEVFGHVPDEISLLAEIEYLGLSENEIKSISPSVIGLPKLKVLDMHKNRLKEIPDGDYGASLLEELYLSYNGISSIPDSFFQLRFAKVLWLANNRINTVLPSAFGQMTLLEELDLESNQFHGSIPKEMFGLTNLAILYLYDNELTGQFPAGLSQMTSLTELDLHSNNIAGQLPTQIGMFSSLKKLYLGNNNIIGQIPPQLFQLTTLTVLDVSENSLNSTIGTDIGNLNQLTELHLNDNYNKGGNGEVSSYGIYGSIPESISSLTLLRELRLDNNYVEGTLPPAIGDLQRLEILRLESNNFHGSIKPIANAKNLRYVHLWSNYFSGAISNGIGQLSQVIELFLDDNELTGSIPTEMGLLSSAKYISLGMNQLEGMIPSTFGMLSSLERLDLQGNRLTGEIPVEIGNIQTLEKVRLEGNQFFGDIPKQVCSLENLDSLSGDCEIAADAPITDDNTYSWSCSCCTTCEEQR